MAGPAAVRSLLRAAADQLRAAGVASPGSDARALLASVTGWTPSELLLAETVPPAAVPPFRQLVSRRAAREPLQHLTGRAAFRHTEVAVGPGVFVPRPETEALAGWAIDRLRELVAEGTAPTVVELCAGSGAITKAMLTEVPAAIVHAVEVSPEAARWAQRNLAGTPARLEVADMAQALPELNGTVDLVVANPPYVPLEAYLGLPPEVRDHEPAEALFAGEDGLDAIRTVTAVAARLLRPGGRLGFEHADLQGESAPAVVAACERFGSVRDHRDLSGRPRFTTAIRRS